MSNTLNEIDYQKRILDGRGKQNSGGDVRGGILADLRRHPVRTIVDLIIIVEIFAGTILLLVVNIYEAFKAFND